MASKSASAKLSLFHQTEHKARQARRDGSTPLQKSIRVLEYLADQSGVPSGVRQIAASIDISPTTVHRILQTLLEANWVTVLGDQNKTKYLLSIRIHKNDKSATSVQRSVRKVMI